MKKALSVIARYTSETTTLGNIITVPMGQTYDIVRALNAEGIKCDYHGNEITILAETEKQTASKL